MQYPTVAQLQKLYVVCHTITNIMLQPIHIIRLDERSNNLFILAGGEEQIELEITPTGELLSEYN